MAYLDLAIDLGSAYTTIFEKDKGIRLRQPSVVVVQNGAITKSIVAIGDQCASYYGRDGGKFAIVRPIGEGTVNNVEIASMMLKYFIGSISGNALFKPAVRAVIALPCGANAADKKSYETVAYNADIKQVDFISSVVCSAYGMQASMSERKSALVCDIGATTSDIAICNLDGVVTGCTINVGGDSINKEIIDFVFQEGSIVTNYLQAERAKLKIASLFANDATSTNVSGIDSINNEPRSLVLASRDIVGIISHYYAIIIDVVSEVRNNVTEELQREVMQSGLYLCGGASQVAGIEKAFYEKHKIEVNVADEPALASILGLGNLLNEQKIMSKLYIDR